MTSKFVLQEWHFEKLSEGDRALVEKWLKEKKMGEIKKLYKEKGVSPLGMDCPFCDDNKELTIWTNWYLKGGKA